VMKALLLAVSSVVALLVASPASGCGTAKTERLPTDAGQIVYECRGCCKVLQPKPGDWREAGGAKATGRGRASYVRLMNQALGRLPMLLHCAGRVGRCILALN
jgi:hypothetical protein